MNSVILQSTGNVPDFTPGPFYDFAYPVHSLMRYVILILLVWVIMQANKLRKSDTLQFASVKRPAFLTILAIDIQLLLGIYLWVVNFMHVAGYSSETKGGFLDHFTNLKRPLKVPAERIMLFEHALLMILAIVLIHIGYSKAKKVATDRLKGKKIFTFYLIGFVLILVSLVSVIYMADKGYLPSV